MNLIVYPDSGYNSFVSENDADDYFEYRSNAGAWDAAPGKEGALITALATLQELDIFLDLTESVQLKAIKNAQCEQALHELANGVNEDPNLTALRIGPLDIRLEPDSAPERHSRRALALLRSYIRVAVVERCR